MTTPVQFEQKRLQSLMDFHKQITAFKEAKQTFKDKMVEDQNYIIAWLLQHKIRFVDASGRGAGPFWSLCKDKNSGQFKRELLMQFFDGMIKQIRTPNQQPQQMTSQYWTDMAINFLKRHEKRKIILKPLTRPPVQVGVADLIAWQNKSG